MVLVTAKPQAAETAKPQAAERAGLELEHDLPLRAGWLAWGSKGSELMACVETDVKILDARTLKVRKTLIATGSRTAFALEDRFLVTSGVFQSGIELVDRASGEGRILNYGAADFQCHGGLNLLAYRGKGKNEGTLCLCDLAGKKALRRWTVEGLLNHPVIGGFSAKGTLLAAFTRERTIEGRRVASHHLLVWAAPHEREPATFDCGRQAGCLAISPEGQHAAVGTVEGTTEVWDLARRKRLHEREHGPRSAIEAVAFSPDGKLVAWSAIVAGPAQEVTVQEVRTGRVLGRAIREEARTERVPGRIGRGGKPISFHVNWPGLAFFPDGKRLAASGGGRVKVWKINLADGKSTK
jgi:hypothetical protein